MALMRAPASDPAANAAHCRFIDKQRDRLLLTRYLNLENDFLKLETAFESQSVRTAGKYVSNVGKWPNSVSRAGNTSHPIIPAIVWK